MRLAPFPSSRRSATKRTPLSCRAAKGDIRFENVSFHYGKGGGVIENLNLHIRPGERVALVGPSGAGKTTIVNLALRLFDVERGRVLIDGEDVRSVTQASLRAQFGVVSQDAMLMHRSIHDNIGYGRAGSTVAEIENAARRAAAHDFIAGVADPRGRKGYDAHVGERGVKLSGGQRAAYRDRPDDAKGCADPDPRRGDLGAGFGGARPLSRTISTG